MRIINFETLYKYKSIGSGYSMNQKYYPLPFENFRDYWRKVKTKKKAVLRL